MNKEKETCIGNPHKNKEEFLIKKDGVEIKLNPGFNAVDDQNQRRK
ncbi:MAG: hypothetical protein J7J93_03325 [Candidatus Aenigmarchaeota archaeon]|nr:hypothetical protein [Candidatus Aenigmarchaeota archaeon]